MAVTGRMWAILVSPVLLAGGSVQAQEGGQVLFNNACRTCHTIKEGDHRLGPSLHAIVGRAAGSHPDYEYSGSMQASGITWDEANLDRFLADPEAVVPGNKMKPFAGIADAAERAAIIAFLAEAAPADD